MPCHAIPFPCHAMPHPCCPHAMPRHAIPCSSCTHAHAMPRHAAHAAAHRSCSSPKKASTRQHPPVQPACGQAGVCLMWPLRQNTCSGWLRAHSCSPQMVGEEGQAYRFQAVSGSTLASGSWMVLCMRCAQGMPNMALHYTWRRPAPAAHPPPLLLPPVFDHGADFLVHVACHTLQRQA